MDERLDQPAFGLADLSNCERELIHLPGSIQPHGVLLVLRHGDLRIEQVSENAGPMLGVPFEELLHRPVDVLGGDIPAIVRRHLEADPSPLPHPFLGTAAADGIARGFEGLIHASEAGGVIVELEPANRPQLAEMSRRIPRRLAEAVARIGAAPTVADLADQAVYAFRELLGYDRVMTYRFDADGHGEVIAEARAEHLEPYLGLHYPSSDIPQRARELYLRTRVRLLVDVNYEPVPLIPRHLPDTGGDLDMSLCYLRSMSPLHLQYLRNMGVTGTLVASLVLEGKLWGLIACHHYSTKRVPYPLRAACDLLSEAISTRLTVLENYSRTRAEVLVRRLEYRLIEATSSEGDWRRALFDEPQSILRVVGARGVALAYDDEVLTAGDVPATPDIRKLLAWISAHAQDPVFSSRSVTRDHPDFFALHPTGTGVLAVEISRGDQEYLVWFRPEQVEQVQWAGDPKKPMIPGNTPYDLSPRRSFAVWTEQVQGTSAPWTPADVATARAIGVSLRDIVLQVRAMSLLLTEHRLTRIRRSVQSSDEGVLVCDGSGRILIVNEAFSRLFARPHAHLHSLGDVPPLFIDHVHMRGVVQDLLRSGRGWRGELALADGLGGEVPVAVRADAVGIPDGASLGFILIFTDLRLRRLSDAARASLQRAIANAQRPVTLSLRGPAGDDGFDELLKALLDNAHVAVHEITDDASTPQVAVVLQGVEQATRRSADLARLMQEYSSGA